MIRRPFRPRLAAGTALVALVAASGARAQVLESVLPNGVPGYDTAPGTTVLSRVHNGFAPETVQLGGYTISPNLYESVGYASNLFGQISHPQGSAQFTSSPSVSVDRSWTDGDINASAGYQNTSYPSAPSQSFNTDNFAIGASHDFGEDTLTAGYSHIDSEIVPSEFNFLSVLSPIPVSTDTVRAAYSTRFSRFDVQPNVAWDSYGFGNSVQNGVEDDISYLDRNDIDAGVTIGYELAPNRRALLVLENDYTYFNKTDPVAPKLTNNNAAVLVGYEDYTGGVFNYFVLAGYQNQSFDSTAYATQSQPIAEGGVVWTPTGLDTVTLIGRHEIEQALQPDQIGFTYDHVSLELDHEYQRNIILSGTVAYDRAVLDKSDVSGHSWTLNGAAKYRANRYVEIDFNLYYQTYTVTDQTVSAFSEANPLGLFAPVTEQSGDVSDVVATIGVNFTL